ncbi:MAG: cupin domain-containing protein [Steroidobacteraceae bacterium]
MKLIIFPANVAGEDYFVAAEKLLTGNPRQTAWIHYTDSSGRFSAGYWRSEPGKWRVSYSEEEFCQILEGVSILTDVAGTAVTVSSGDSFVVPGGFSGTWEVVETTRKLFVISEPAP